MRVEAARAGAAGTNGACADADYGITVEAATKRRMRRPHEYAAVGTPQALEAAGAFERLERLENLSQVRYAFVHQLLGRTREI